MDPTAESIAYLTTFGDALDALCLLVDEQASGLMSGVLVLDSTGTRWRVYASPRLPDSWRQVAGTVAVTPTGGASGVAVHERRQILVTDLAESGLYPATSVQAARAVGLQACWATPFFSQDGRVLGVVTIYCDEPRAPTEQEQRVITRIAHLASIATERTLAQEALDASEERFRRASQVLAGSLFDWDAVTDHLEWFGGMEDVLGFKLDEIPADARAWYESRVHPEDAVRGSKMLQEAFDSGASGFTNVYRIMHRDGYYVDVAARARIIRDATGRPVRVVGGVSDISARRRLEREREDHLVREHAARVAAEEAARQRDHVLEVVAHELGSPLSTIGVCARVLAQSETSPSERASVIDLVDRCVESMYRLIRDLSDVASIESGRLAISARAESPSALVAAADERFTAAAALANVTLETSTAPELPEIRADAGRLIQVLGNLLTNALRHTPPGGRISVRAEDHVRVVRFTVEDTGTGIATEELPHLFDRFWHTRRVAHRGGGLGLTIARGIVEAHGGTLDVHSTMGEGSTFSFTIPTEHARGGLG
jgi:PAS domain S-box-containing protein